MNTNVLDGSNLILMLDGNALGFSTGCKISTSAETGERITKETSSGQWAQKFVKKFSETISADGCVLTDGDASTPTYDAVKSLMLAGAPITAKYNVRDGVTRLGKEAGGYSGSYIITSLDLDGQAGEDSKYSIQLENCGPVVKDGNGLSTPVVP